MSDNIIAKEMKNAPRAAPTVEVVPGGEPISVISPLKPLSYEEADAKIREGADSFSFNVADDCLGRVDVVSLGTKLPSEDRWDVGVVKGTVGQETLYAGIYDGHNGIETSEFLRKNLIPYVANALASLPTENDPASVEDAIRKAFVSLDDRIMGIAETALAAGHPAGTAEPSSATLRIALAGDSRAVRAQWSPELDKPLVDVLSQDQTVCNEQEYARIAAAHPGEADDIMDTASRSLLAMGVTRAFGDHRWKWPAELVMQARGNCHGPRPLGKSKTPPYMTASPEMTTRVVGPRDFVILGSDGLWEAISNEDAVECVSRWVAARRAGTTERVAESRESRYDVNEDGSLSRTARPEDFAIEDLDNAAVCLLKNVLGGRHKYMVAGALTATPPISRYVRDDITVQVIFFQAP
ncbi:pyruvate dehydrogenase, putative [Cordyceps militaris CM01]|uniref:Pyruvate dehydrogenase, putative n=1 Tax=Cordyceps militaris (strain CM01) TaxID=983644 RepID=G3JID3_CORMM|nr:pyruvate dehydrogenase, putative [Cordyceps militaris CM01]EGX91883.1 pyruvate dehydrogenase, putative [Cordyceps militaris CM01]